MKFSDELSKLKAGFAKEHVRRLESSHSGAIETLKQNIKRFFR